MMKCTVKMSETAWDEHEELSSICKFLESTHPKVRHNLLVCALLDIKKILHYLRSGTITVDMVQEILDAYDTLGGKDDKPDSVKERNVFNI